LQKKPHSENGDDDLDIKFDKTKQIAEEAATSTAEPEI
jgi:hypothetical protein